MQWQTVIKKLNREYERAKNTDYVVKPMAYTLYKIWHEVDKFETKRNMEKRLSCDKR